MSSFRCTRENCRVAESGNCLEGFLPVETCPYAIADAAEASEPPASEEFVPLPSGEALSADAAAQITRRAPTNLIMLAGPVRSGKTTLLNSIYESFQEAPFATLLFSGSDTLVGLEKRCHEGRVTSGRGYAETPRTPQEEGYLFLHLRLAHPTPPTFQPIDLLISDVSGEHFRRLRDSTVAVRALNFLSRVDRICLILDGEKLANPASRQLPRNDARALLRSLLEAGALRDDCHIDVVFTKWDLVLLAPDSTGTKEFVDETKQLLIKVCSGRTESPRFFEVAARPEAPAPPFGHGVPTLLRAWSESKARPQRSRLVLPTPMIRGRESSRFASAVNADLNLENHYDVSWA
jgi:hypothetical protein